MALAAMPSTGPASSLGSRVDAMGTETLSFTSPTPPPPAILHNPIASSSSGGGGGGGGLGSSGLSVELVPSRQPTPHRPHFPAHSTHSGGSGGSDSASVGSASAPSSRAGLSGIFARRGSLLSTSVKKARSIGSNRSSVLLGSHDDASSHSHAQSHEMHPVRGHGKKHIIQNHEARMDRRKAEAAVSKWRKWIVEQPATAVADNPLYPTPARDSAMHTPARTPPASIRIASVEGHNHSARGSISARGSLAGHTPHPHPEAGPSSDASHHYPPSTPGSQRGPVAGALDIYTTESVRVLRDVELAVDPEYFGHNEPSRARRLSTHPRLSDMENPFSAIDTLLCRRGIRPLVLELVHALGAYIDAVWSITYPDRPIPWSGVPMPLAVRRSSMTNRPPVKVWRSWTITAIQEGKRRGFLTPVPTEKDVLFWGWEIRYGLRDIDEAVNRRKDLGWAFGESVIRGQYGDITPANVLAGEGKGGNVARLLNDLEEALWGDAIPAKTDLAFEVDADFDPFSVYREGDELVGVERNKLPAVREADLREVFGEAFVSQVQMGPSVESPFERPLETLDRRQREPSYSPASPKEVREGVAFAVGAGDLDLSALGALQEMSMEEKMELGRRRHQEYLERVRV